MNLSIKWLGHASFQIKAEGKTVYIDPYEGE
ncbi:MBL fold metallo-hydrolase, partial [Candidatus Bathyarchaeota archaeon]|nr:MBL fold metallo-hydrolase [Candidatus Bathyarchaeota archaeon]